VERKYCRVFVYIHVGLNALSTLVTLDPSCSDLWSEYTVKKGQRMLHGIGLSVVRPSVYDMRGEDSTIENTVTVPL
jgi:hypothetical protein